MPDKFSTEIGLVNKLRVKLVDDGWNITQLVCSGGQAHFSISYKKEDKIKNIFPDVLAFNENYILIGEIKEKFDKDDYLKLLELKSSDEGLMKLLKVVTMRTGNSYQQEDIIFTLIHSEYGAEPIESIYQYIHKDGEFHILDPL